MASIYGHLTLTANTPGAVPIVAGLAAYAVTNSSGATIYIGFDNTVSSTTGTPIPNGQTASVTLTFIPGGPTAPAVWVVSGSDTTAVTYLAGS